MLMALQMSQKPSNNFTALDRKMVLFFFVYCIPAIYHYRIDSDSAHIFITISQMWTILKFKYNYTAVKLRRNLNSHSHSMSSIGTGSHCVFPYQYLSVVIVAHEKWLNYMQCTFWLFVIIQVLCPPAIMIFHLPTAILNASEKCILTLYKL